MIIFSYRPTEYLSNQELLSAHLMDLERRQSLMSPRRISASSVSGKRSSTVNCISGKAFHLKFDYFQATIPKPVSEKEALVTIRKGLSHFGVLVASKKV